MPQRWWRPRCNCWSDVSAIARRTCDTCGVPGEFDGWHYTTLEKMAAYQYRYGMLAVGPHRTLADGLLEAVSRLCEACQGRGLLTDLATDVWEPCPACDATRSILTCDQATLDSIRQQVAMAFPGSLVDSPMHPLRQRVSILDLSRGLVVGPESSD